MEYSKQYTNSNAKKTRCKAGKRPPSAGAHPFTRQACTERLETKWGPSRHERHRHPELANERRIDAGKREAERKGELRMAAKAKRRKDLTLERTPDKETEALVFKTYWDESARET